MPDNDKLIVQLRGFDAQHYTATERYALQIDRVYKTACDEFARLGADIDAPNEAEFSFDKFPKARKQAQGILTRLVSKIEAVITAGIKSEWLAACKKNDAFLNSILRTSRLTKEEVAQYQDRNLEALSTFQQRKVGGLGLSERVWQYAGELKDAMELGIDVAIGEGKSAQELGRDLRGYLQEPDRLYRRVRDKGGNLRLSKAAKLYHPGQGVYRSSARNAQRLARTEVNMAYRESEFMRWQRLDFVVGFRVCLSNNHTTKDSKGKTVPLVDICDELYGDYPKTFKFTGWHPQCRCYVVPIMSDYDEYNKDRANRLKAIVRKTEYKSLPSRRTVRDVPAKFRSYIASIQERAKGWKSMPYYIRDNFKGGRIEGGLNGVIPTQTMNTVEPCTDFDAQIATLKRWAYSFGLDLSNIESLRTAGNRNALETEVEKQRALGEKRQNEWHNAWNELKEFASTDAAGYKDVIDFCEKALKGNDVTTANYYADCISRLKQALTDARAKLRAMVASSTLDDINEKFKKIGIAYNVVKPLTKAISEDDIIQRVGGGDLTKGSCSSLAYTYAANKAGLDVLDFRDGESRYQFSQMGNIRNIAEKVGGIVVKNGNDFKAATELLNKVQTGKEYYFTCGKHAAIVRKSVTGYEYLELQTETENGFKELNKAVLKKRFGAQSSHTLYRTKIEIYSCLVDIDLLKKNTGFQKMMGYINTQESKQRKGKLGTAQ